MKKGAIITAIVLLTAGLLIFVGGLFAGGSLPPMTYEAMRYSVNEPFADIHIDTHEMNIEFILSEDGTCSVDSAVTEKFYPNVTVRDGVLTVTTVDERTWVDRLMMSADQPMQIRLPGTAYRTLSVESHTGDVTVDSRFSFDNVQITASTGDVTCGASAENAIEITASTGDITLENVKAEELWLVVSTGRIAVKGAEIQKGVLLTVSTGKLEIDGLSCESLTSTGSTGRVTLRNLDVEHALWIERSTGDVNFENVGAETITVHTETGDVTGTLRSAFYFVTETNTGKVRVPDTHSGGRCEITTSTGDIRIEPADAQNP
ncbi:MAG: DUF4097 family beta strand repeat protein [Clostridia bacterium]|nr:DUF4097 family beta strand repeat protein [Clostridia bacterium]